MYVLCSAGVFPTKPLTLFLVFYLLHFRESKFEVTVVAFILLYLLYRPCINRSVEVHIGTHFLILNKTGMNRQFFFCLDWSRIHIRLPKIGTDT